MMTRNPGAVTPWPVSSRKQHALLVLFDDLDGHRQPHKERGGDDRQGDYGDGFGAQRNQGERWTTDWLDHQRPR
jgi:hypothetical protein